MNELTLEDLKGLLAVLGAWGASSWAVVKVVVRLTPTPSDNAWVKRAEDWFARFAPGGNPRQERPAAPPASSAERE